MELPPVQYDPAVQVAHALNALAPVAVDHVPAGQLVGDEAPAGQYAPDGHDTGAEPPRHVLPAGHATQVVEDD